MNNLVFLQSVMRSPSAHGTGLGTGYSSRTQAHPHFSFLVFFSFSSSGFGHAALFPLQFAFSLQLAVFRVFHYGYLSSSVSNIEQDHFASTDARLPGKSSQSIARLARPYLEHYASQNDTRHCVLGS